MVAQRKNKKGGTRKRPSREARLNLLLDPALKEWIRSYAVRKHTSITAIVIGHFVELRDLEEAGDVEQI